MKRWLWESRIELGEKFFQEIVSLEFLTNGEVTPDAAKQRKQLRLLLELRNVSRKANSHEVASKCLREVLPIRRH